MLPSQASLSHMCSVHGWNFSESQNLELVCPEPCFPACLPAFLSSQLHINKLLWCPVWGELKAIPLASLIHYQSEKLLLQCLSRDRALSHNSQGQMTCKHSNMIPYVTPKLLEEFHVFCIEICLINPLPHKVP